VRTERFRGILLSTLMIASIIALALPILSSSPVHAALTPHATILINGNGGFTSPDPVNGGGSGTLGDPYIIENYIIDASTANGIDIMNTTAHFVVRNCVVENGWIAENEVNYDGIELINVVNGKIDNNICENNDYGILLVTNSDNNVLTNNTCENNIWYGIRLEYSSNNALTNNTCENNKYYGIGLHYADNNTLDNNTIENGGHGIYLYDSDNIKMRNNTLSNNRYNFGMEGTTLSHFVHDIDTSNLVNGKPIRYLMDNSNEVIGPSLEIGFLGLVNCDDIRVENLVLDHNKQGILIASTQDSRVENCIFDNNAHGIYLSFSDNNILTNNTCENGGRGITFLTSSNNTLTNNTVENNKYYGIHLGDSDNNIIKNNTFSSENEDGVRLYSSDNNIIENNTIENNARYGIHLVSSDNNTIYHNNFINNDNQAYDDSSNLWDDGYPSGGNYWSDYTGVDENKGENQDIPGSDGIGDTPYYIPGDSNRDRYPLMSPIGVIPWTGTATFSLVNLYTVNVEKILDLNQGSKLVVKFYAYDNVTFENENVIETFVPPAHVEENENARHPEGIGVKRARLVLTDGAGAKIATIATFTVTRSILMARIAEIDLRWPYASFAERSVLMAEIADIDLQWPYAPF